MRRMIFWGLGLLVVVVVGLAFLLYTPDEPRPSLEAIYAQPPSEFINVLGVRLHVRDTGPREAPAIILLHGFGASLQTWDDWSVSLSRDFRVICYDQPGFGLTGEDPSGDYSDERSMDVLAGLMDRLGVAHASIVGHSMGGRIAWRFAAAYPDRVDKLVLIAPDGFASPGLAYDVAPEVPLMMRALPYVLPGPMLRATLAPAYANPSVAMTAARYRRYRDMMLAPGVRQAILDRMAQTVLVDPEPLLRQIKAPTLLLWGDQDAMIPHDNSADYLRDIKASRMVSFPDVGHLVQEEAPAASLAALLGFLGDPSARPL